MRYVAGMREALRRRPPLITSEMNLLALAAQSDKDNREEVVVECMGLIVSEAKRCRNTLGADALGEASVAFLEAVDSFESEQGDFRTWAVYLMRCHLGNASQKEKRFRARILRGEEALSPSDPTPLPELLSIAVRDKALTERQAQIVHAKANGSERAEIIDGFAISEKTYYRELERALSALRRYL